MEIKVNQQARLEIKQLVDALSGVTEDMILQACKKGFHNGTIQARHVRIWEKLFIKKQSREHFKRKDAAL